MLGITAKKILVFLILINCILSLFLFFANQELERKICEREYEIKKECAFEFEKKEINLTRVMIDE